MIQVLNQSFYFLRHGETEANNADIIAGSLDSPLTVRGASQADRAAQVLAQHEIGSIWHSPLSRAAQTAQAVQRLTGAPMFELAELSERRWGDWEGKPRTTLHRDKTPPNGEGPMEFRARIRDSLHKITGPYPVLIVGHSGTAREIHNYLSALPFERLENGIPVYWHADANHHWHSRKLS